MLLYLFKDTQFWGAKALDYSDFCKIIVIKNGNKHLTVEGMADILDIYRGMNSKRTKFE